MATAPSTKPYRAVAVAIGDVEDEDGGDGTSIMDAGNNNFDSAHLMSEPVEEEARGRQAASTLQFRFGIVVTSIFAISLFFVGGRAYHNKQYSLGSDATQIYGGEDTTGYNSMDLAPSADDTNQGIMFDIDNDGGDALSNSEKESPNDDYFVPLTADEREEMKEMLRSTLRETKNALLSSTITSGNHMYLQQSPQRTLVLDSDLPKQFMHMHHMKTGGTSLDGLISCSIKRQRNLLNGTSISYSSMSECGSRVRACMDDLARQLNASVVDNVFYHNDATGSPQVDLQSSFDPADEALHLPIDDLNVCTTSEANVMSYCASLHTVRTFGWKDVDKITIIRNPVDRAWSMYRFKLSSCYKCQELKDVLRKIENGTFAHGSTGEEEEEPNFVYGAANSCAVQMIGHQATNLLSSIELYNVANDVRFPREREIVKEAVRNLRKEFTWIGITDRIEQSIDGMRSVFPFLAENLSDTVTVLQDMFQKDGERFALPEGYNDDVGCAFEHRNAGRNPSCGTTELDDETIALIEKLNHRDVAVYKAAVERFELQMEVLNEYRSGYL